MLCIFFRKTTLYLVLPINICAYTATIRTENMSTSSDTVSLYSLFYLYSSNKEILKYNLYLNLVIVD